jgi:predicted aspartyl protease
MDDIAGILVVQATINGKGPYHFVLDTGAGITVLTPDLAKRLASKSTGNDVANGMGGKAVQITTTSLDRVSVGAATQTNVAAATIPLPLDLTYQGRYGTIDGIIGYSFLRHYVTTIDIAHHRATFTPSAVFHAPQVAPIALTFSGGNIPVAPAAIDGAPGHFEIDSGNNAQVVLTGAFASAHHVAESSTSSAHTQYEGVGGRVNATLVRLQNITTGSMTVHDIAATISSAKGAMLNDAALDGNFGYDFLRRFVATIDYSHATMYLVPTAQADAFRPIVGSGIMPKRNADGTFGVAGVNAGSPAERAGVEAGDTILKINGQSVRSMSLADYKTAAGTHVGTQVVYTLTSKGKTRSVSMILVDMLPSGRRFQAPR